MKDERNEERATPKKDTLQYPAAIAALQEMAAERIKARERAQKKDG